MEKNEGVADRIIRLVIGLVTLYLALTYNLWWLVVAIPALLTALTGFCWPYKLLGINTAKKVVIKQTKSKKKKL